MKDLILLKLGEIVLKGLNRRSFEDKLIANLRRRTAKCGSFRVYSKQSTIYVEPVDANRFRVMSAVPYPAPMGLYVACSLLATVGAILVSPECVAVALGLTLGLCLSRA